MAHQKPSKKADVDTSVASIFARNVPRSIEEVFPIVGVLRKDYTGEHLKSDVIAGLTVAVMVVPQGMAYAALASLTPEIGLYSCIVPIVTYALLGTSRQLAVGPVAMVALLTSAGLTPLADPREDPARYQQLASTLAFLVGCMQAGMALLKLEFVARFLPHPVLSGFTSAAAVVIGSSQLKDVFKLSLPRSERLHEILEAFFDKVGDSHALTVAVSFTSIAALVAARHLKRRVSALKRFPEALFLVVFWILVSHYADFKGRGVKVIGEVPSGFPSPTNILWGDVSALVSPALSISLVGFLESFAVAKTIAEKEGYEMSAQRELLGLGLCNVAGAFFKCMPVTGGFSRSAVNYQAGAKSTVASIITAVFLVFTVLLLTPLFRDLPKPILSAIIIVAVSTLVDVGEFTHLWKRDKRDFVLVSVAFTCTLFWGLLEGILVSAGLAIIMLVQKVASPHSAVLVKIADDPPVYRNRDRFPDGVAVEGVLIYRMDAPLFYANADSFKDEVTTLCAQEAARVVIVHGGAMAHVDSTGVGTMEQLRARFARVGVTLVLCEFNGPCREILTCCSGVAYDADGCDQTDDVETRIPMFLSLNDAVEHAGALVKAAKLSESAVVVDVDATHNTPMISSARTSQGESDDIEMSWAKTVVSADE